AAAAAFAAAVDGPAIGAQLKSAARFTRSARRNSCTAGATRRHEFREDENDPGDGSSDVPSFFRPRRTPSAVEFLRRRSAVAGGFLTVAADARVSASGGIEVATSTTPGAAGRSSPPSQPPPSSWSSAGPPAVGNML
ncbi:unnamed protein product, partial [Ectocarpus sp. 12 AP-2014]